MNSTKLDKAALTVINRSLASVNSKISANSKVDVRVTGWVQPTSKSPNIAALSKGRAMAVVNQLKTLGLAAKYIVEAPGEDRSNTPSSRRATVVVSITTP
jgi:outer membrane protein OmpA-like peptidoglycan-associated protein